MSVEVPSILDFERWKAPFSTASCRNVLLDALETSGFGRLCDGGPGFEVLLLADTVRGDVGAQVCVRHPRFYRRVLLGGALGAAEAYLDGDWSTSDLTQVMRLLLRHQQAWEVVDSRWAYVRKAGEGILGLWRRNTRRGSRQNIAAHYDLSNAFFSLFLDPTMMYSSAYFSSPGATLEQASEEKLERLCQKLELKAQDHVLEIGSGWGGFAVYAAQRHGCRVTTTTISREQYEYTVHRVREAGLERKVRVLQQDYRDLQGQFDKLVSIEMVEAVGSAYLEAYFRTCSLRLKPDGVACLQAICCRDQDYHRTRREVDFIKRYIFPGGCLPSLQAILNATGAATDFQLHEMEDLTAHYALTLRHWRNNFLRKLPEVRELGFDQRFIRMWEFYLCYCEAGFAERNVGVYQLSLVKPRYRAACAGEAPERSAG